MTLMVSCKKDSRVQDIVLVHKTVYEAHGELPNACDAVLTSLTYETGHNAHGELPDTYIAG